MSPLVIDIKPIHNQLKLMLCDEFQASESMVDHPQTGNRHHLVTAVKYFAEKFQKICTKMKSYRYLRSVVLFGTCV